MSAKHFNIEKKCLSPNSIMFKTRERSHESWVLRFSDKDLIMVLVTMLARLFVCPRKSRFLSVRQLGLPHPTPRQPTAESNPRKSRTVFCPSVEPKFPSTQPAA